MNGVFANEDPQPLNSPRKQRRGVSFIQIIIVWVALSLLAVNIAILYVIHYADKPGTPKFTAVGSSDFMTLNGTELSELAEGTPVSVTDDGKITVGAGTSYYLNRHVFTDAKALYVQNNPLSNNTMLVSYFNGKQTLFNISTVGQYNPTAVSTSQVGSLNNPAKRVIPLSSTLVLIIANNVSSDFKNANNATNNLVVYPATIDGTSFTVLSEKGVVLNSGFGPSLSIGATKQSGSQLLVTIYGQDSKGVTNCYVAGVVVGDDKSLDVIKPTFFADDSNFTTTLTDPVALGGNDFFLPYYNDSGLCGIFATIENNNAFKLNTPGCLTSVKPQNFFSATPISDSRVAVAFSDSKQNNAIRVVDIAKYLTGIPTFGSIYTLDTGDAFLNVDGAGQLFYQLNIGNIGEGRVLVTFSDMANQGIITGQVLTITSISGFLPITPPMPMSVPVSETGTYVFNEIAYLGNNRFSLVYSYWLGKNTFSFGGYDIGEILPTPLGIVGDSSNVLVSGSAFIPDNSLKLGISYYSTTQGKLVAGLRHGSTYPYITTDSGTTVVSLDSYIGVAADSSTLVLNR